jgi:hypothetical protein
MDDLFILTFVGGSITLLYIITHIERWVKGSFIYIDSFTLNWFERRGLKNHYQTWGHCGLCGKPIEGIFLKGWAWGICAKCLHKEGDEIK